MSWCMTASTIGSGPWGQEHVVRKQKERGVGAAAVSPPRRGQAKVRSRCEHKVKKEDEKSHKKDKDHGDRNKEIPVRPAPSPPVRAKRSSLPRHIELQNGEQIKVADAGLYHALVIRGLKVADAGLYHALVTICKQGYEDNDYHIERDIL